MAPSLFRTQNDPVRCRNDSDTSGTHPSMSRTGSLTRGNDFGRSGDDPGMSGNGSVTSGNDFGTSGSDSVTSGSQFGTSRNDPRPSGDGSALSRNDSRLSGDASRLSAISWWDSAKCLRRAAAQRRASRARCGVPLMQWGKPLTQRRNRATCSCKGRKRRPNIGGG